MGINDTLRYGFTDVPAYVLLEGNTNCGMGALFMKNIQLIDGALNCAYDIFAATEEEFAAIFPRDQDIEFDSDLFARVGKERAQKVLQEIWKRRLDKKRADGIHGTYFVNLDWKKKYYPTKKDLEAVAVLDDDQEPGCEAAG